MRRTKVARLEDCEMISEPQSRRVLPILFLWIGTAVAGVPMASADHPDHACEEPPDGIIGWWPFDETRGTWTADIGPRNNPGFVDGPKFVRRGKVCLALNFQGMGNVKINGLAIEGNVLTLEAWVNPELDQLFTKVRRIISNQRQYDFRLELNEAHDGFFLGGSVNLLVPKRHHFQFRTKKALVLPGQYSHVALVLEVVPSQVDPPSSRVTLFVNGEIMDLAGPETSGSTGIAGTSLPVIIGEEFWGIIDEVTIYDRALDSGEIEGISEAGESGKCKIGLLPPSSDPDRDGVPSSCDNCPEVKNPNQENCDNAGTGDACEGDRDGDGVVDVCDNCPDFFNPSQRIFNSDIDCSDDDGDGICNDVDPEPRRKSNEFLGGAKGNLVTLQPNRDTSVVGPPPPCPPCWPDLDLPHPLDGWGFAPVMPEEVHASVCSFGTSVFRWILVESTQEKLRIDFDCFVAGRGRGIIEQRADTVGIYRCGSLQIAVLTGTTTAHFRIDGLWHTVIVNAGGIVTLDDTIDDLGQLRSMRIITEGSEGAVIVDGQFAVPGQDVSIASNAILPDQDASVDSGAAFPFDSMPSDLQCAPTGLVGYAACVGGCGLLLVNRRRLR